MVGEDGEHVAGGREITNEAVSGVAAIAHVFEPLLVKRVYGVHLVASAAAVDLYDSLQIFSSRQLPANHAWWFGGQCCSRKVNSR